MLGRCIDMVIIESLSADLLAAVQLAVLPNGTLREESASCFSVRGPVMPEVGIPSVDHAAA